MSVIHLPRDSQPRRAMSSIAALWRAGGCAIEMIQRGEEVWGTVLTQLARQIRELCGRNVAHYQQNCDRISRDLHSRVHCSVYEAERRKLMSDRTTRTKLLDRADELENLERTREPRDENLLLAEFCQAMFSQICQVRDIKIAAE